MFGLRKCFYAVVLLVCMTQVHSYTKHIAVVNLSFHQVRMVLGSDDSYDQEVWVDGNSSDETVVYSF